MTQVLRARTISETRGFLKALVEVDGDRILGFTAFASMVRDHGVGTDGYDGRIALSQSPPTHFGPPDLFGRRSNFVVLVCAFAIGKTRYAIR